MNGGGDEQRLLAEAVQAAGREDWTAAVDLLRQAKPTAQVLDRRAFYLSLGKRYHEALADLAELRRLRPDDFRPWYTTGYQYYRQEQYREAVPWFEESLKRRATHLKTIWVLAFCFQRMNRPREAQRWASRLLAVWNGLDEAGQEEGRPQFAKACHLLGKACLEERPELAAEYFQAASDADPRDPWHLYCLGSARRALGVHNGALAALDRAANLKPGDVWIELERAAVLAALGDEPQARAVLERHRGRLRGWEAERGGRIAMRVEDADLAVELLTRALRDKATRGHARIAQELQTARTRAGLPEVDDGPRTGRVDVVRADRGFGFLVDDIDGARRHFRLPRGLEMQVGQQVRFIPQQRDQGPAAMLVADTSVSSGALGSSEGRGRAVGRRRRERPKGLKDRP